MNPTNTQLLSLIYGEQVQPAIIETQTVQEGEQVAEIMYIGYPLPSCKSEDDERWLIKRVKTVGNTQTIMYPNGSRQYNQAWSKRASADMPYKINENF